MCIIINKPAGVEIKFNVYQNCIDEHPDGVGIAYVEDNKIVIKKGLWDLQLLFEAIQGIEKEKEIIFHFRTASPGMDVSVENCHPFLVESRRDLLEDGSPRYQWAIVHNGRLDWRSTKELSDTRCMVDDVLYYHLNENPDLFKYHYPTIMLNRFINNATHSNNKVVFLKLDRLEKVSKIYTINEVAGNFDSGIWFSNLSWRWPKITPKTVPDYGEHEYMGEMGWRGGVQTHGYKHRSASYPRTATTPAANVVKHPEGGTVAWLKARFPGWVKPDASGWFWNFEEHIWEHEVTKLKQPVLQYRDAPYDPGTFGAVRELRRKALEEIFKASKDKDTSIPVQTTIPKQMSIITVPRDADKSKVKQFRAQLSIEHLNKAEIALLVGEARTMMIHLGHKKHDVNRMKQEDLINELRDNARLAFDYLNKLDLKALDEILVQAIKTDTLDRKAIYSDDLPAGQS